MERQCPHCGKVTQVSDEELALHGNVVVCPQCLSVYSVDGATMTAEEARRMRHAGDEPADRAHYCSACGKHLPAAVNYCPNCGARLSGNTMLPSSPAAGSHAAADSPAEPSPADKKNSDDGTLRIPFLPYRFNPDSFGALLPQPKASRRTQAVAYTVILLLLALLVVIIVAAYRI